MHTASPVPPRPVKQLAALAVGAFAIGLGSFVVIGALDEIARALAVTPRAAGWIISAYALCYAVSAPISALLFARANRRTLLILALSMFTLGNLVCILADNLATLITGHIVFALGAAMFTPTAASLATELMGPGRKGLALSFVYGGMTVSQAAGVPITTWIAQTSGWRYAFVIVLGFGLLAVSLLLSQAPKPQAPTAPGPRWRLPSTIPWPIVGLLATSFLIVVSDFTVYSYVSVILSDTWLGAMKVLPLVLLAFGVGAIIGNVATGLLTDRIGPTIVLLGAVAVQTLLLILMILCRHQGAVALAIGFGWGVASYMYLVPIQHRLLSRAPDAQPLVLAMNGSLVQGGVAVGAAVGGAAMESGGMSLLAWVAALIALAAFLTAAAFVRKRADE